MHNSCNLITINNKYSTYMNINEHPLKSFNILKNPRKYMKINQIHSKFTKINENPKSFSYERCNLNQVISQIKIPLKHALNVISCDFCPHRV